MKIERSLKYAKFEWDDENKTFTITQADGNKVCLNKVYAFSFMRFVTSMAQRNWFRKTEKTQIKQKDLDSLAESGQFVFDEALNVNKLLQNNEDES